MSERLIDRLYRWLTWPLEHRYFNRVSGLITILNPIALVPQLKDVIIAEDVRAISIPMWAIFCVIQIVFTLVGIKTKNTLMFWSMLASILISIAVISVVFYRT
ncbi:hypothetical protein HN358_03315 [Candidatus Uhrbacteria bacterium]|nr:hypothetical protein [Candidatus Uhrbacteria bacterium]MBT7717616.1 hypothetical protein [Candidatus Uhrbacteria bacterium]